MPDIHPPPPDRPRCAARVRRVLRVAAVVLAVVVTVLAAEPPQGVAAAPGVAAPAGWGAGRPRTTGVPAAGAYPAVGPTSGGPVTGAEPTPVPGPGPGPVPPGAESPAAPRGAGPAGATPSPGPAPPGAESPATPPGAATSAPGPAPGGAEPVPPPVRPPGAGQRAPGADYAWPLHPVPTVAGPFRRPSFRFGRGHRGADLAGAPGQAVLAAREGTVVFAGRVAGRPVVSVDHPDGLRTTYEPVLPSVRVGDRVTAGDPIGVLVGGHAGCPGATCLHWGVRRGKVDYLDPLVLVRPPRLRLLPWDGA